jgi:hypothetical protein
MSGYSSDLSPYYQILEIEPGASLEEIKRAYREQTKIWHPDRFPADDFRLQSKAQEAKANQLGLRGTLRSWSVGVAKPSSNSTFSLSSARHFVARLHTAKRL